MKRIWMTMGAIGAIGVALACGWDKAGDKPTATEANAKDGAKSGWLFAAGDECGWSADAKARKVAAADKPACSLSGAKMQKVAQDEPKANMVRLEDKARAFAAAAEPAGKAECAGGACAPKTMADKAGKHAEKVISTQELRERAEEVVIIDARGETAERIPGAKALAVDADEATIRAAVGDGSKPVVTYCGGPKCPLSKMLAKKILALGYEDVIEYREGIAGWQQAGLAVERTN